MVDFDGNSYDDKVYDFKGGDAEVIAGNQRVIDEVMMAVKVQRAAIEKVKDMLRSSAVKGPASARMTEMRSEAKNKDDRAE